MGLGMRLSMKHKPPVRWHKNDEPKALHGSRIINLEKLASFISSLVHMPTPFFLFLGFRSRMQKRGAAKNGEGLVLSIT